MQNASWASMYIIVAGLISAVLSALLRANTA